MAGFDPQTVAAGDRVKARLSTAIVDEGGNVLVPQGTPVSGRIIRMDHYYWPHDSLKIAIKLEGYEVHGISQPLAAVPAETQTPFAWAATTWEPGILLETPALPSSFSRMRKTGR